MCEEYKTEDADLIIAAYGISARVSKEAVEVARKQGLKIGMVRPITLWPFPYSVFKKYAGKEFLAVEMSNGQFIEDVKLGTECKNEVHHLGYGGGWYPDTNRVVEEIKFVLSKHKSNNHGKTE